MGHKRFVHGLIVLGLLAGLPAYAGVSSESDYTGKKISTPSNPASGYDKMYFKSDEKLYGLTSAGVEALIGPEVVGNEVTNVTNATLTRSGSGTDGAPYTLGLNLGNANSWTGQQTFGTSSPIFGTMTAGSVFFAGTGGLLSQDNANLFYDNSADSLGVGLNSLVNGSKIETYNESGYGVYSASAGSGKGYFASSYNGPAADFRSDVGTCLQTFASTGQGITVNRFSNQAGATNKYLFYVNEDSDSDAQDVVRIKGDGTGALLRVVDTTTDVFLIADGGNITATGTLGIPTITLSGTGTLNGLDAIDSTTETTLEAAIDIAGDVTGTGLGSVVIADNAVDGTDIALGSDAQGDVMYYNGTDWVRLAAGTSGQKLETRGAGANPVWDTDETGGGGGAFTDLSDVPASYAGEAGKVVAVNGGETGLEFIAPTGSPAGSDRQFQFNDSGGFGGAALLAYQDDGWYGQDVVKAEYITGFNNGASTPGGSLFLYGGVGNNDDPVFSTAQDGAGIDLPGGAGTDTEGGGTLFLHGASGGYTSGYGGSIALEAGAGYGGALNGYVSLSGSYIRILGGQEIQVRNINDTNATVALNDYLILFVTALTASRTVTLPDATTCGGHTFVIKDGVGAANTYNIVVDPAVGNIDGASTKSISTNYGSMRVFSDGTNYYTI